MIRSLVQYAQDSARGVAALDDARRPCTFAGSSLSRSSGPIALPLANPLIHAADGGLAEVRAL